MSALMITALIIVFLLHLGDLVFSVIFIEIGWMTEGNLFAKKIYDRWGTLGLIVVKVPIVIFSVTVTWLCLSVNPWLAWVSTGLTTLYGLVPYPRLMTTWYWFYWRRGNL